MWYRIDTRRLSFRDFLTEASWLGALFAWLITRLPWRLPCSTDLPAVNSLQPFLVPEADVPAEVKAKFSSLAENLHDLGFRGMFYHHVEDSYSHTSYYFASFLHTSTTAIARLGYRVFHAVTPIKEFQVVSILSRVSDGSYLVTTTSKSTDQVDEVQIDSLPNADVVRVWSTHQERMRSSIRGLVVKIRDGRHLLDSLEEVHGLLRDGLVQRKILVPLPDEESASASNIETQQSSYDSLLTIEVRKIERKPPATSKAMLLTLACSLIFFVAAGGLAWDWQFTLLLVPILLFHEAGHFLAMKLFDYQNVRMFFIPMFGAAVTGKHYNVPGWKKIVTSLMGPTPGVLLGVGLGIVAMIHKQDELLNASLLMLFLNGVNLLPVLPLDGGWIVHGLLFSRHAFLDFLFRLAAIGLLVLGSAATGDRILLVLGVFMAIGLSAAFHTARITDRLRGVREFPAKAVDGQVPDEAIDYIGAELDKAYPKGLDIRAKAKFVLQIFNNVNARPPGWLGSLLLGGVYVASLIIVVVAGSILYVGKFSDLSQLALGAPFGPQTELIPTEIVKVPPGQKLLDFYSQETLVKQFSDRLEAEAALAEVQRELQPNERLVLAGNALLLILPAEVDENRIDQLFDRYDNNEFPMAFSGPEAPATLSMSFVSPNPSAAKEITEDLAGFFAVPASFDPIPPWHPTKKLAPDEKIARQTVHLLNERAWMDDVPGTEEYLEAVGAAQRRGQDKKIKLLAEQRKRVYKDAFRYYFSSLCERPNGEIDQDLLNSFEVALAKAENEVPVDPNAIDEPSDFGAIYSPLPTFPEPADWLGKDKARLGLMAPTDPLLSAFSTHYGTVDPKGLVITIIVSFDSLPCSMLALVDWLDQKGCNQFKYNLYAGEVF